MDGSSELEICAQSGHAHSRRPCLALAGEEAIRLITEVADLQTRLERLRLGLRQLVEEAGG